MTVSERRILVAELPPALRCLYSRVLATTLGEGVPVAPNATAVLLSTLDESYDDPMRFTKGRIEELVWFRLDEFCQRNALLIPKGWERALFATLAIAAGDPAVGCRVEDPREVFNAISQLTGITLEDRS